MKFFVGYLIMGEAGEWHRKLTEDISSRFHTWKLFERHAPHITLFSPFETENIEPAKSVIQQWARKQTSDKNFIIEDFGRFEDDVVFADVACDTRVHEMVRELRARMKAVAAVPEIEFPIWRPHASLARLLSPEQIRAIWDYVSKLPKPHFTFPFDKVTLFRLEDERWVEEETFPF